METVLLKYGWVKSDNLNEWTKYDWTARLLGEQVEIYNDIDKNKYPKYFSAKLGEIDLKIILEAIEEDYLE